MFDKYEIKTYPEYCIQENPETDSENELDNLPFKKATYVDDNNYPEENVSSDIFNKGNNNISEDQSSSKKTKNSIGERKVKYKKLIQTSQNSNYDSDIINKRNTTNSNLNIKKKYLLNKIGIKEESKDNNTEQYYTNQAVNLNKYFNIRESQLSIPQKTLKRYKNQYLDVEKSDNFKVLSYRPDEYESDINNPKNKSKKIQIFKKQEASELFFPSKRAISPPSPHPSTKTAKKEKNKDNKFNTNKPKSFYQAPMLKFQSFFGSFMGPKIAKNSNQAKSTSKSRVNQLKDFNIEKLIEIGDNNDNKWNNILSFGKKIQSIKNRHKIKKKLIQQENMKYKVKTEVNIDEETQTQTPIQRIQIDTNDYNLLKNKMNNKKVVYHGQIKRKRNIKKNQTLNAPVNQIEKTEVINQNVPNKLSQSMSKNSASFRNRRMNTTNTSNNNNYNNMVINNNNNPNENRLKKKITKSNPKFKGSEFFYQSQNGKGNTTPSNNNRKTIIRNSNNNMLNKISPIKTLPNKKVNLELNDINKNNNYNPPVSNNNNNSKFHYSIRNFNNIENGIDKNKYMNYSIRNKVKSIKKELSNKNMLDEIKEIEYNESNENDNIEENKIDTKKGAITDEEKFRKISKVNNGGIDVKKSYQKEFKNKRYYGYDDRHNLEGPINNHTVYVSVYTKKNNKN